MDWMRLKPPIARKVMNSNLSALDTQEVFDSINREVADLLESIEFEIPDAPLSEDAGQTSDNDDLTILELIDEILLDK